MSGSSRSEDERGAHHATIFTSRSGTTITLRGARAVELALDLVRGQRERLGRGAVEAARRGQRVAQLAVDLDRERHLVVDQQRRDRSSARPRRRSGRSPPSAAQHSSARCGAIGAISRIKRPDRLASRRRRLGFLDRAGQLVELRDRLVELERRRSPRRPRRSCGGACARAPRPRPRRARRRWPAATRRWTKRDAPSIPASDHSRSRSGGLSESMNQRTASAP